MSYPSPPCMHINQKLQPLEPHLCHFLLESERGAWVREHKQSFFNQRGSNTTLRKHLFPKPKFREKNTLIFHELHFSSTLPFTHFILKHIPSYLNIYFIELPIRSTNPLWLAFHLSSKSHESDFILDQNLFLGDLT